MHKSYPRCNMWSLVFKGSENNDSPITCSGFPQLLTERDERQTSANMKVLPIEILHIMEHFNQKVTKRGVAKLYPTSFQCTKLH